MEKAKSIVQKIKNREPVFGAFYKFNSSVATEIMGHAGFDFIIVDCEHSNIGSESVENIINTAKKVSLATIVRVPSAGEEHIFHVLDSGAEGVQIPNISRFSDVETAVRSTKYFPLGTRGLSRAQSAAKYGFWTEEKPYVEYANENTIVVVHIENKEMVDDIEKICQYPQIDVLFVGPADLSQSLGIPGQVNDPRVVELTKKVFDAARKYNKVSGTMAGSEAAINKYMEMGATYLVYGSDVTMFANAAKSAAEVFKKFRNV